MSIHKRIKVLLITLIMLLSTIIGGLIIQSAYNIVNAETTVYSDVLDDLEKDETFNLQDYPQIAGSYDIELIQIAESTTGELLLYVYQPGNGTVEKDVKCSSINMAIDNKGLEFCSYTLTFLDSTNVFSKYKVNGFSVSKDTYRYYTISVLYRPWISGVDENPPVGSYITEVDYVVGYTWRVYYLNNELLYECKQKQFVDITDIAFGFVRYPDGYILSSYTGGCDSHFVAFSCNFDIDNLIDADVRFSAQGYRNYLDDFTGKVDKKEYGEPIIDKVVTLSEKEEVVYYPSSWFNPLEYEWKRIETSEEFIENESFSSLDSSLTEENFSNRFQYVLRFYESLYDKHLVPFDTYYEYTTVYDISILRLHFTVGIHTYNLGAVSPIGYGDNIPDNNIGETILNETKEEFKKTWEKLEKIILISLIILIVVILSPILNIIITFFKLLFKGIKIIFSILFFRLS